MVNGNLAFVTSAYRKFLRVLKSCAITSFYNVKYYMIFIRGEMLVLIDFIIKTVLFINI